MLRLLLNLYKHHFLQFSPKINYEIHIKISCDNKRIKESKNTKSHGIDTDSFLSWKTHIDQMTIKLNRVLSAISYIKHFMYQDTLRTIYITYFQSIISRGIIFWIILHKALLF